MKKRVEDYELGERVIILGDYLSGVPALAEGVVVGKSGHRLRVSFPEYFAHPWWISPRNLVPAEDFDEKDIEKYYRRGSGLATRYAPEYEAVVDSLRSRVDEVRARERRARLGELDVDTEGASPGELKGLADLAVSLGAAEESVRSGLPTRALRGLLLALDRIGDERAMERLKRQYLRDEWRKVRGILRELENESEEG